MPAQFRRGYRGKVATNLVLEAHEINRKYEKHRRNATCSLAPESCV